MRQKANQRMLALVLAVCTFLGLGLSARAASIADGSKTCTVKYLPKHYYLTTTAGTAVRAGGYTYTTNDNITGPAYCIDHGLDWTGKALPITSKYNASPATAGAFANGYPQMPMSTFLDRNLDRYPALSGLTEDEYCYATQIAVWATLGQLAVDGTAFSNGRERLAYPNGDAQQIRVFEAVRAICHVAKSWDRVYQTGMYIRASEDQLDGNVEIPQNMTLDFAADEHRYGIRREVINGVSYYTKEYIFASATSTYWQDYTIDLWATGCPAGTIFTNLDNEELPRSKWRETDTWRTPVENHQTGINYNGFEYGSKAKLCIPVDTATPSGEIILYAAAQVMQYEIYLANNEDNSEQSYILADPSKGTVEADAVLSWGGPETETGRLKIIKVGGGGLPLAGATFTLTGTDGTNRTATTDSRGEIFWDELNPNATFSLEEKTPPAGYGIVEPITNIKVIAAQTTYRTVQDNPEKTITVRKIDKQNGYSLRGAVICFEQVDGDFKTTKVTDHAGLIQFDADRLPIGSYKIYEVTPPEGMELDSTPQTVHWDGKRDVTLTFENVRKPTLIISKQSSRTHYNQPGATFKVYKDGRFITTVTTNDAGLAYVHDATEGYWEVKEVVAPANHLLDDETHGIYIDPYDPATADDPRIVVVNDPLPSLRVLKYDRASHKGMPSVTFEIFKDTVSLGEFQTDQSGEILLSYVEPGTYRVVEKDTGSDSHILDTTPQEVELRAGDDVRELIFFNDRFPGVHLIKVDSGDLSKPIPNAKFRFESVKGDYGPVEYTTLADGTIDLSKLPVGSYVVTELECAGYVVDDAQRIIYLDGNDQAQFVFTNSKLPSLHLTKYSADGTPLAGVSYRLAKIEDGSRYLDRTTSTTGEITWEGLEPGVFSLQEIDTLETHILDETEYHVEAFPGKDSEVVFYNDRRPNLTIHKTNADDSNEPVPNTVFTVKSVDGATIGEYETGPDGTVTVPNLSPQVVVISEKNVPSPYLLDAPPQTVILHPNQDTDVYFENHKAPVIEIIKESSITGERLSNTRFQVWYASNSTGTGELNDLGTFTTGEDGRITLTGPDNGLRDGWFRVRELTPCSGYALADSDTQEAFVPAGKSHTFRFTNTPLSALVVWKFDTVSGAAVPNCRFTLRYLGGNVSGSEGTIIGTYTTSVNGSFTVTGLKAGYYICEEISSDGSHVIDTAPQSVYISGKEQDVAKLCFGNAPKGSLLVTKVSSDEKKTPLSDVEFLVTESNGTLVGDANGKFKTDSTGSFLVEGITPGTTLVVKEVRAKAGYLLDDTPQTATIQAGQTVKLEFRNQPLGGLIVEKLGRGGNKTTPLAGVKFEIKYANGQYVDAAGGKQSSNGIYYTNSSGKITLPGIVGTVVVTELESVEGYTIDPNTRTQTVTINPKDTQTLRFYNDSIGGIELVKVNEDDRSERISNVTFEIHKADGTYVDIITTDKNGRASLFLEDGDFYGVEVDCPKEYKLDATPFYFTVKDGKTVKKTISNQPFSGILLRKVDSTSGNGIPGAVFIAYNSKHDPIGEYVSDQRGYVYIDDLPESGRYYLREIRCDGYFVDDQLKTVYVKPGETTEVIWKNTPITGQIQITKTSADYNPVNGWPAGTLIPGTEFEVYNRAGVLVDTIRTDKNGVAVTKALPLGCYTLMESKAADNYLLDKTPIAAEIEFAGQIVRTAMTNKSVITGVSITKTGYAEVMPDQTIRYTLKDIANTSSVSLNNFYWRDTLPSNAVRLSKVVTGTWNAQGSYKLVYRTNLSGNDYRTLADNLSTTKNYTLDASPVALRLAANEYVTEVMAVFGVVPTGFRQVEQTKIDCTVVSWPTGSTQFTNQADVGGTYNSAWVQATSRWVTKVYAPTKPLPRTGY